MISRTLISYKRNIRRFVDDIFERLFKSGMFSLTVITFVWIAVFLYVIFYYTYVPISSHVRPIHLQIAACDDNFKLCAYPSAHVRLTKRNQLLMKGQQYKFRIQLEMPESPVNMKLGMFMVCVQLKDKIGFLTSQSCRSNMLHYSSDIIQKSKIIVFFPLFLFGGKEEKQIVNFELYSDFTEDQNHPVTDVYVEVQTRNIELYSANLYINAHLVGLRYFMYHWPITSAIFGISISLFVIFFTMSLSFYHNFFVNTADDSREMADSCLSNLWFKILSIVKFVPLFFKCTCYFTK
ncbi:hypothetical protein PGB90_003285 [Kerria lacca]